MQTIDFFVKLSKIYCKIQFYVFSFCLLFTMVLLYEIFKKIVIGLLCEKAAYFRDFPDFSHFYYRLLRFLFVRFKQTKKFLNFSVQFPAIFTDVEQEITIYSSFSKKSTIYFLSTCLISRSRNKNLIIFVSHRIYIRLIFSISCLFFV